MQTKFLTLCVYMCAFIREFVCESEIQEIWNVNNSAYWERGREEVVHQCNNIFLNLVLNSTYLNVCCTGAIPTDM